MTNDKLRQRLYRGDKIRVNHRSTKKELWDKEGTVVKYYEVKIKVDGDYHFVRTTCLDVLKD